MRQSNTYVVLYAAAITVVCGVLLAVTAYGLKPRQMENIELERKKNILAAVGIKEGDFASIYQQRVKSYVVDYSGKVLEGKEVTSIVVAEEYKKPVEERLFPVYEIKDANNTEQTNNYVMPIYGFGLWNNIWGYVALEKDLSTIAGISMDHAGETAGLGARIATEEIQTRFVGKKIYNATGTFVAVKIMKGENGGGDRSLEAYANEPHKVDGMSGATLTGNGVNDMLVNYLGGYNNFIQSLNKKVEVPAEVTTPADTTSTATAL